MMKKHWSIFFKSVLVLWVITFSGSAITGTFNTLNEQDFLNLKHRLMAAHFLSLATFGPTPEAIETLAKRIRVRGRRRAFSEWIDEQFAKPASLHKPLALQMILDDDFQPLEEGINVTRYVDHAWWHNALTAGDQLRQRMAWALSQVFVINRNVAGLVKVSNDASGQPQYLGIADYYDMLLDNAFGNYRKLLEEVSLHPVMGVFLSHAKNPKGDPSTGRFPDENYARELMQLFSIGLFEMNRNGTYMRGDDGQLVEIYDNNTVNSFARIFTGLSYARSSDFSSAAVNYHEPMVMYGDWHDTEEKILLRGEVLPAGQSGIQDIRGALDNVFNHPNVPPFLARLFIQRFVTSNPSRYYIDRVAKAFIDNGKGVRGDFKAVLKAVLLDRDAINTQNYAMLNDGLALISTQRKTEYSRLREPVLRYTAFYRAFNATSEYPTRRFMIPSLNQLLNQSPYMAPSVFGFYRPDYQPPGDIPVYEPSRLIPNDAIYAPEFQIMTSVVENRTANLFLSNVRSAGSTFTLLSDEDAGNITSDIRLDFSTEIQLAARPDDLLAHLDFLLCHGGLSDESKAVIADTISRETSDADLRAKMAVFSILTASDCAIE